MHCIFFLSLFTIFWLIFKNDIDSYFRYHLVLLGGSKLVADHFSEFVFQIPVLKFVTRRSFWANQVQFSHATQRPLGQSSFTTAVLKLETSPSSESVEQALAYGCKLEGVIRVDFDCHLLSCFPSKNAKLGNSSIYLKNLPLLIMFKNFGSFFPSLLVPDAEIFAF